MGRTKGAKHKRKVFIPIEKKIYTDRSEIEKHFQYLKDAPLEEYLPRICYIASLLKAQGIKI